MDKQFNNRLLIPSDWKVQYPAQDSLIAPVSGVHDGDMYYFACNADWRPIITGWLSWLTESTYWQDAETENNTGQENISTFLETMTLDDLLTQLPGETIVTTQEELQQAVCDGIMCAVPKVGTVLAGGINSGISVTVDDNGDIVIDDGSTGDTGLSGTDKEILWGGAVYLQNRLQEYITDYEDFFNDFPADESQAVSFLSQKYQLTAGVTQAVSDYYAHRNLSNPAPQPLPEALSGEFFCYGATKQSTASYMIDNVSNDLLLLLSMLDALTQDQYDTWVSFGQTIPRVGYNVAPCYRVPPQTVEVTPATPWWNSWVWEPFTGMPDEHVFRVTIKCTEEFVNPAGDTFDGVYHTPNGGNSEIVQQKWFQTYLYWNYVSDDWGAKKNIGETYVSEVDMTNDVLNGINLNLATNDWTQGRLEITAIDLGHRDLVL